MKQLIIFLLLAGAATGAYFAFRPTPRKRLIERTATLIEDEGKRTGKPVNRDHLILALERFETGTLRLFSQYVEAFIRRDFEEFKRLMPEIKTVILPVLNDSPEWRRYEDLILPT